MIICTATTRHGDYHATVTGSGVTHTEAFTAAVNAMDIGYRPNPPNIEGALRLLRAHGAGTEVPRQSNYAYYDTDLDGEPIIQIGWCDFTFTVQRVKLWAISAQVTVTMERSDWRATRQVPTFYLDPAVQGITDQHGAIRIAHEILSTAGPVDEQRVDLNVSAEPVY